MQGRRSHALCACALVLLSMVSPASPFELSPRCTKFLTFLAASRSHGACESGCALCQLSCLQGMRQWTVHCRLTTDYYARAHRLSKSVDRHTQLESVSLELAARFWCTGSRRLTQQPSPLYLSAEQRPHPQGLCSSRTQARPWLHSTSVRAPQVAAKWCEV